MDSVTELFLKANFGQAEIELLSNAYDKARKSLHDKGQPAIVNEIIAERIIAIAQRGEFDTNKLCSGALAALGNKAVFE